MKDRNETVNTEDKVTEKTPNAARRPETESDFCTEIMKVSEMVKARAVTQEEFEAFKRRLLFPKNTVEFALEQLEVLSAENKAFEDRVREVLIAIAESPEETGGHAAAAIDTMISEHGMQHRRLLDFYIGMVEELKNNP